MESRMRRKSHVRFGREGKPDCVHHNLLILLPHRNDANGHIPQQQGLERWQDRGMGTNYREILQSCAHLGTDKVLAWTWVISPAPDLMALVPEPDREALVLLLIEQIVEAYYEARGMDIPEYSYVLHDRLTKPDEPSGEGQQQLHTHIVLPATVPTIEGAREPFYNRSNKGHFQMLRNISTEKFSTALDELVGPQWRELRLEPEVTETLPQLEVSPSVVSPQIPVPADWERLFSPDSRDIGGM